MLREYLVLVEGVADLIFFRDYFIFLDSNLKLITKKIKKELTLESQEKKICIRAIGGYTEVQNEISTIKYSKDKGEMVFVIQDADNPQKENGGIHNRNRYLNKIKEENDIQFETFLFPNHQDDGDLETLLLQIKKEEKYNPSQGCYQAYIECTKNIHSQWSNELEEDKSLVFNYFRIYYGMKNSKEENRKYEADFWDFKSEALSALKGFFDKNEIIKSSTLL
jgi:hypothetical protein